MQNLLSGSIQVQVKRQVKYQQNMGNEINVSHIVRSERSITNLLQTYQIPTLS